MVCQLTPLVSLGLNNPPRIWLTPRKSRIKNLWRNKQGNCWCKMAGAGIRSFAKLRGQMPRIATFLANLSQVDCGLPSSALMLPRSSQACGNLLSNSNFCLWQSAAHIWAWNLARDWIPAAAILHRESPCLKRHIFLPHDF
jgi:hypothetical protein